MTIEQHYSAAFYDTQSPGSRASAAVVVPLLLELFKPKSVVDVGCGVGSWLAAFHDCGVEDIAGFDGDWVAEEQLLIPPGSFHSADLEAPIVESRRYDMALCLEVAEHLSPESVETLVSSLVSLSQVIVFSGAIPYQGGSHHINERWPEYWVERFRGRGFVAIDCIRPRIWRDDRVDFWYAQNMLAFVHPEGLAAHPDLDALQGAGQQPAMLNVVHPRMFLAAVAFNQAQNEAVPIATRLRATVRRGLGLVIRRRSARKENMRLT